MVEIGKSDFQYLMSRRPLLRERVVRRAQLRYTASWKAIGANSVFANFSMAQITQLQSVMTEETGSRPPRALSPLLRWSLLPM